MAPRLTLWTAHGPAERGMSPNAVAEARVSARAGVPTEPLPPTERSERLHNNQRAKRILLVPSPRGEGQDEG